jgi:hypothetical protein
VSILAFHRLFLLYSLIEEALVCGSFVFVLKLTNNSKVHFMKFAVLREEFKSFLYHTVSLISSVVKKTFEFFAQYRRYSKSPPRVDFGNPGGGWRKIVLRGVLRGREVETVTSGGKDLSECDRVFHTQTVVEIDP